MTLLNIRYFIQIVKSFSIFRAEELALFFRRDNADYQIREENDQIKQEEICVD